MLNNAQHFNFFVHVEAWNISGANLSCQKKKKNLGPKILELKFHGNLGLLL